MLTLDEQIEQVRLNIIKFYKAGEWLSAYQSWRTWKGLKAMRIDIDLFVEDFAELTDKHASQTDNASE